MLEKPSIEEKRIAACLQEGYGLAVKQVTFLPIGADLNTAVYRVVANDEMPYFLKLRSGTFDSVSVELPKYLSAQGIAAIIPSLTTQTGRLWADLEAFTVILYQYVEGSNGYEVSLSDQNWIAFGKAFKSIHTAKVPAELLSRIRIETYSPRGRDIVKKYIEGLEAAGFDDPIAIKMAAFLRLKRDEILELVQRADHLARRLNRQPPEMVVCHSDVHAGNILIDTHDGFHIIDWDEPIRAPKERDLMYAGGAQGFTGHTPAEEERLFFLGYGETVVDPRALAYYRYERIIQDIAVECEQIVLSRSAGDDREQALHFLKSNFLQGGPIEIACRSDQTRPENRSGSRN